MREEPAGAAAEPSDTTPPPGSASAAAIAGIVIPLAAAPLVAVALPAALFLSWWILGELLGREIGWMDRQRGGMQMMASAVCALAAGAIASALAGIPLVKYLFRSARPRLLFRVGAAGMLVVAAAFWLWFTRNSPDRRIDVALAAALGWLGSLLGLKLAADETDEGSRARAAEDARIAAERRAETDALMAAMEAEGAAGPATDRGESR